MPGSSSPFLPLSILHRLPVELVTQVFSICVCQFDMPPEHFCQLDRHLRYITLGASALWAQVTYSGQPEERDRFLKFLKLSATSRIDLWLRFTGSMFTDAPTMKWTADAVSSNLFRTRTLCISMREEDELTAPPGDRKRLRGIEDFLGSLNEEAPLLDVLELDLPGLASPPPQFLLGNAPRLRQLSATCFGPRIGDITLHSVKITILHINYPLEIEDEPPEGLMAMLIELPELAELTLVSPLEVTGVDYWTLSDPCTLPNLCTLRLRVETFKALSLFRCPRLQHLITEGYPYTGDHTYTVIWSFLSLHRATLVSLDLTFGGEILFEVPKPVERIEFAALRQLNATMCGGKSGGQSALLLAINGKALEKIWLTLAYDVPAQILFELFNGASTAVVDVRIDALPERFNGIPEDPQPPFHDIAALSLVLPRLTRYISGSRLGDLAFVAVKSAPRLESLSLHGQPRDEDSKDYPDGCPEDRATSLPGLRSLTVKEFSAALRHIHAEQLQHLVVHGILPATGLLNDSPVTEPQHPWSQARARILDFVGLHARSLETLQLHAPIGFTTFCDFRLLKAVMIHPGDVLGEWCSAPKLEVVELIDVVDCNFVHRGLSGFITAHTLIISNAQKLTSLMVSLQSLPNVTRLTVRLKHPAYMLHTPGERNACVPSINLLCSLSRMSPLFDGAAALHWALPNLRSVEVQIMALRGIDELRRLWLAPFQLTELYEDPADRLLVPLETNEGEDSGETDIYDASSCASSDCGSDDGVSTWPFTSSPAMRRANRSTFRRILQALRDLVILRRAASGTADLTHVTISTDGEFRCNFGVPEYASHWFDSVSLSIHDDL